MRIYPDIDIHNPQPIEPQPCSYSGCTEEAFSAYAYEEGYEAEWYCWKHAHDSGYCPMCGDFWGGIESFDFGKSDLCENCQDEIDDDSDEYDDDEYGWDMYPSDWYDANSDLDQLEDDDTPRYIDITIIDPLDTDYDEGAS